jgi:ribosomal protein S18 acetylase RimI-like enzyme
VATITIPVKTVAGADEDKALSVLTLAFSFDPVMRWVYPDPQDYLKYFPQFLRAFASNAFPHGTGHYIADFVGAALWLPPNVHLDEEAIGQLLQSSVPERRHEEVFGILEQMGAYHPTEPHWYLPVIGIDPTQQGKGYGSTLLRFALEQVDRDGVPAYLESSNPRNNALYERHGFEVAGEIQAGSATLWPMVRRAR